MSKIIGKTENDLLKLQIQLEQTKNKILKYEKR